MLSKPSFGAQHDVAAMLPTIQIGVNAQKLVVIVTQAENHAISHCCSLMAASPSRATSTRTIPPGSIDGKGAGPLGNAGGVL
jgi:hypothetical protein